ncbi:MAG: nucleotidyltransferase family protein [Acidobacteriaceae bacterium]
MLLPDETGTGKAPQLAAIVLAAGASTRLGRPKQLVAFCGKSLLRRAAEAALASGASPVVIVLGDKVDQLRLELAGLPVLSVINPDWQQGMGSSMRCGVDALRVAAPSLNALLCMVCDQPRITEVHLRTLWERYAASGKVVAVRHGTRPGVPAIFPAKYLPDLAGITGDKGARSLLGRLSGEEIELFDLPEAAFDLDTPADLHRLGG